VEKSLAAWPLERTGWCTVEGRGKCGRMGIHADQPSRPTADENTPVLGCQGRRRGPSFDGLSGS
jgi:hypothetical protein